MNTTFIRSCHILLISTLCMTPAWADGTITHLSGEISVQKKDGTILPGMVGTKVNAGDVMITGANGYGRLEMTDGGEMVLRPNSQLKVESYRFQTDKPADDSFVFHMLKGGLRTVTGLIGKRGNKDAYEGKAASATIGIRGTQFDLRLCQGDCGVLADGTYLAVRFGAVRTGNAQGNLDVAAGQVALVQAAKPPVILPRDPGIGFTPPAVIPKLDEKKKVQAATTAAATTPAQEKPAESSSEKSSQSSTESSEKKDSNHPSRQAPRAHRKKQALSPAPRPRTAVAPTLVKNRELTRAETRNRHPSRQAQRAIPLNPLPEPRIAAAPQVENQNRRLAPRAARRAIQHQDPAVVAKEVLQPRAIA